MSSRTRIAAAACLVASGLLVTGGSASLAFANPETGTSGDGPSAGTGSTTGSGTAAPTGAPEVTAPTSGSTGTAGTPTKPTSTVGNGRTGVETGTTTGSTPTGSSTAPTTAPTTNAPVEPTQTPTAEVPVPTGEPAVEPDGTAEGEETTTTTGTSDTAEAGASQRLALAAPSVTAAAQIDPVTGLPVLLDPSALLGEAMPGTGTGQDPQPAAYPWPFSWWNSLPPVLPGNTNDSGATAQPPIFALPQLPQMQLPQITLQQFFVPGTLIPDIRGFTDPIFEVVTGLATAASQLPFASVTLPVIVPPVGPDAGVGAGNGGGGGGGGAQAPGLPRITPPAASKPETTPGGAKPAEQLPAPETPQQTSPPATATSNELLPAPTYRMGYVDYLRAAGLGQVAAVAVPGVTGILVLTSAGGLIGYRQARAGRAVRTGGPARFMG